MIISQKSKIKKNYFLLKKPSSLKQAMILSVLFHGFVFMLCVLFVNKQEVMDFSERIFAVEVVSVSPKSSSRQFNNNRIGHTTKLIVISNNFQKSNISNSNKHESTIEETLTQKKKKKVLLGALLPISPKIHRLGLVREPKLLPPIKAMSQKQQKFFVKETDKIVEKLQQLPLSDSVLVWRDKKQIYQVKVCHERAKTITDLNNVIFIITTRENEQILSTEMRLRQMAFSNYAQFVDYWDPKVAIHNDEFFGKFHSNSSFKISRRHGIVPKFYGKVTTASYQIKTDRQFFTFDDHDVFSGGLERGIKEIRLPKKLTPFSSETKIDSNQIHLLSKETWIEFVKNGTYLWKTKTMAGNFTTRILSKEKPFFIVANKKVEIHIRGTVCGKILMYSKGNIILAH